jgi:hypothetical protein
MSNKHYRTPAKTIEPQTADPDNLRRLGKVKAFLEKLLDRAVTMLDEAAALPKDDNQRLYPQHEWFERRSRQVATVARLGIAACRTMLQAMRLDGTETEQVRKLLTETVVRLEERIAAPLAATG